MWFDLERLSSLPVLSPRWGCFGCLAEPGLTPGPIVCRASGADGGSRGVRRGRRLRGLSGWDARRGFGFHDLQVLSVEAPMRAGTAPNAHFHLAGPGRVPGGRRAPVNRRLAHPGTSCSPKRWARRNADRIAAALDAPTPGTCLRSANDACARLEGPPNFPINRAAAGLPANDGSNCAICLYSQLGPILPAAMSAAGGLDCLDLFSTGFETCP